jgi:hypothetical protein
MVWLQHNLIWIVAAVVGLDNVLEAIPAIEANSTLMLILNSVKKLAGLFSKPTVPPAA